MRRSTGERAFQPNEPPRRRAARSNLLALIGFIGLSALAPIARAALAAGAGTAQPLPWVPAALLYSSSGVAAWLVWRRIDVGLERKRAALRHWGWQLLFSGLWPAALYGLNSPALAVSALASAFLAAALTLLAFRRLQASAALLLLPYLAWLFYATLTSADRFWGGLI